MFKETVPKRACLSKDGYHFIKSLKTKLVSNEVVEQNDALDECIIQMVGEGRRIIKY